MRSALSGTGRLGIIVPTGIATDDTTKAFFADCVEQSALASLYDFDNAAPIFPGVHRSYKFCLLTLVGPARPVIAAEFAFFARQTADLADDERRFPLTPHELALINPNTHTAPVFRTRRDAELTLAIYRRVPALILEGPSGRNSWRLQLSSRIWHMSEDAHFFSTAETLAESGWILNGPTYCKGPDSMVRLYEGKLAHLFDSRWATHDPLSDRSRALSAEEHNDPCSIVYPRYWVPSREVNDRLSKCGAMSWLLGFRNIARTDDERTLICAALPRVAVSNSMPLMFARRMPHILLSVLSSFVLDYLVRQKVGGSNVTFNYVMQFAVLDPDSFENACPWQLNLTTAEWVAGRTLELTYTAWDLVGFGASLGYAGPPFRWDPRRRRLLRAELDAALFQLYGLEREEVDYVMDTFPIVRRKDEGTFGEYRTKRLILERYDAMVRAIRLGEPYLTVLDPPPAHASLAHPESTRPAWAGPGEELRRPSDRRDPD